MLIVPACTMRHGMFFCDYCESERRRDLPDGKGGIIKAVDVHRVSLCGLADLVAIIVDDAQQIPD
jgi:hypothetical protein